MICLLAIGQATSGQAQAPLPPERPQEAKPAEADPIPPYQPRLERLAELMGTLAFMRTLCGAGDGAQWRDRMADLMTSEGSTPLRRDRLAGAFNKGFEEYRISYRTCTPAAHSIVERAFAEGERLTHDLATHFGS